MYELDDYLAMVTDEVRTSAYLAAMAAVIRPGDRVLELGTGFGYFAVHACRLGAAHVWAIEPNDAVAHGRALAAANGCADRITFIQDWSERVTLPERADLLVEDLRGISPLHGARLATLRDARARLLAPAARRIPLADELVVAPSELPADLSHLAADAPESLHGISVAPIRRLLTQSVHRTHADAAGLLAGGETWARIDLADLPSEDPSGAAEWVAARAGRLAGLVSWFRALLAPGIAFETAPARPRTVYTRAFLPVEPVDVLAGDRIAARVRTKFDGNEYVWVWDVEVTRGGHAVAQRCASNLATRAMSARRRAVRAADHRPPRTEAVETLATLSAAVTGEASLAEIARTVRVRHPSGFATEQDALRWAGDELARLAEDPPR